MAIQRLLCCKPNPSPRGDTTAYIDAVLAPPPTRFGALEAQSPGQRWILSWGSHVRVLAPPQLIERIRAEAQRLAAASAKARRYHAARRSFGIDSKCRSSVSTAASARNAQTAMITSVSGKTLPARSNSHANASVSRQAR